MFELNVKYTLHCWIVQAIPQPSKNLRSKQTQEEIMGTSQKNSITYTHRKEKVKEERANKTLFSFFILNRGSQICNREDTLIGVREIHTSRSTEVKMWGIILNDKCHSSTCMS